MLSPYINLCLWHVTWGWGWVQPHSLHNWVVGFVHFHQWIPGSEIVELLSGYSVFLVETASSGHSGRTACLSLCVFMFTCMCCSCMWRPEVDSRCFHPLPFTLSYWVRISLWNWSSSVLGAPASLLALGLPVLIPSAEIMVARVPYPVFMWILGIWTLVLRLVWQTLYPLSYLPSLSFFFF